MMEDSGYMDTVMRKIQIQWKFERHPTEDVDGLPFLRHPSRPQDLE